MEESDTLIPADSVMISISQGTQNTVVEAVAYSKRVAEAMHEYIQSRLRS